MKQYQILFYKKRNDSIANAIYYREFESFDDLIEWCKSVSDGVNYSHYKHKIISKEKFLLNTK